MLFLPLIFMMNSIINLMKRKSHYKYKRIKYHSLYYSKGLVNVCPKGTH